MQQLGFPLSTTVFVSCYHTSLVYLIIQVHALILIMVEKSEEKR